MCVQVVVGIVGILVVNVMNVGEECHESWATQLGSGGKLVECGDDGGGGGEG